ncbi:MAG: DMT family transporter [Candidatus Thalassarchaeaceae archaeon]|nr:DMT family transporter [Candidatus Thalassarchaeaceae archaeon]
MADPKAPPAAAWLTLSVAVLAVSSAGIVLQEMSEVPPLLRASWRMQGTALVLLPGFLYQFLRTSDFEINRNDARLILASSLFLAAHFGSWVWSLDNTSLVHSLLFVNTHPLVVVAIMPFLGEVVRRGHITGVVLGFVGATLSLIDLGDGGQVSLVGDLAAFAGAVTVVGYILVGRHLRSERGMPIFIYAFPVTMAAGIWLSFATVFFEGSSLSSIDPSDSLTGWSDPIWIAWVAYLSLGPGLCGHTGVNTVLRWIPPIVVSIALLMEPVLGAIIGWLWTDEVVIGMPTVAGGLMMMTGAIIVTLQETRQNSSESVS